MLNHFLVGGMQRSGTSLLRAILGSHSNISMVQYDVPFWIKYYDIYFGKNLSQNEYKKMVHKILANNKFYKDNLNFNPEYFESCNNYRFINFYKCFLKYYSDNYQKPIIGIKTPFNEFYYKEIKNSFNEIKFIHVVRNPLDVAASYKKARQNIWGGKYSSIRHIAKWSISTKYGIERYEKKPEKYLLIKYEDILDNPERAIIEVCNFLNIDFEKKMLEMNNHPGWEGTNTSHKSSSGKKTISKNSLYNYDKYLKNREINKYTYLLGYFLDYFNYEKVNIKANYLNKVFFKFFYLLHKMSFHVSFFLTKTIKRSYFYKLYHLNT